MPDISQRVVGFLMELATLPEDQREVTQAGLDRAIAGYDCPLSISAADPECRSRLQLALSSLAGQLQAPPLSHVLPRRDVEKMLREPSVALAIVCGPGGAGSRPSIWPLRRQSRLGCSIGFPALSTNFARNAFDCALNFTSVQRCSNDSNGPSSQSANSITFRTDKYGQKARCGCLIGEFNSFWIARMRLTRVPPAASHQHRARWRPRASKISNARREMSSCDAGGLRRKC
ncbi:MAG TPA: hypothetical protein VFO67_05165 [Gemmatimonadales bacterium]|nr:hypothetical protein [Gemmatimonadales bacterium]